ncbi:MAG: PEGA domain-containing protein [Planctomycetota bacterium]
MAAASPRRRVTRPRLRRHGGLARSRLGRLGLLTAVLLAGTGCQSTHRRLTIDTQPRGAVVLVDGEPVGFTPASISYDYYATRRITLIKDGFQQESFLLPLESPWWQRAPLEFVTDNLLPTQVEDRRVINRVLKPKVISPADDVINRADELRSRSQTEQ